jgi:hypothetical protein
MAKYDPINENLQNSPDNEVTLSFKQVEKIIGDKLPPSAYRHQAWWANEAKGNHVHAHAWMDVGWEVETVNQREHWVRFTRKHKFRN